MKIAISGTDKRLICLAGLLKDAGHEMLTSPDGADIVVSRWPADIPENKKLVTFGPEYAPEGVVDLLKDEKYQKNIAWMTAEGAVAAAMGKAGCAIRNSECMVVGWGRIGRALTQILVALGGKVTVLSRRSEVFPEIADMGAQCGFTYQAAELIGDMRYVFSTPPSMVINEDALKNARKDSVIIDLASPPYGVDLDAAQRFGLNAWREPGIPGRYCPENAAMAIYEAMREGGVIDG